MNLSKWHLWRFKEINPAFSYESEISLDNYLEPTSLREIHETFKNELKAIERLYHHVLFQSDISFIADHIKGPNTVKERIANRGKDHPNNFIDNIHSFGNLETAVNKTIKTREHIRKQIGKNFNLKKHNHLLYQSTQSILAYAKTIGQPEYTLPAETHAITVEAMKNGILRDTGNFVVMMGGLAYNELSWIDMLSEKPSITLFDASRSAHTLSYQFFESEKIRPNNIKYQTGKLQSLKKNGTIILNNFLTNLSEKQAIDFLNEFKDVQCDMWIPLRTTDSNTQPGFYTSDKAYFTQNFAKEYLLADTSSITPHKHDKIHADGSFESNISLRFTEKTTVNDQYKRFFKDKKIPKDTYMRAIDTYWLSKKRIENIASKTGMQVMYSDSPGKPAALYKTQK